MSEQTDSVLPKSKPFYKKWWVWVIAIILLIAIFGGGNNSATTPTSNNSSESDSDTTVETQKEWVEVIEVTTTANKDSETFTLEGGQQRLSYNLGQSSFASCMIYLEKEGHDIATQGGFPVVMVSESGSDNTILRKAKGDYYISVNTANAECSITLEELR